MILKFATEPTPDEVESTTKVKSNAAEWHAEIGDESMYILETIVIASS